MTLAINLFTVKNSWYTNSNKNCNVTQFLFLWMQKRRQRTAFFFDTKFFYTKRFLFLCEFWQQIKMAMVLDLYLLTSFLLLLFAQHIAKIINILVLKHYFDFANFLQNSLWNFLCSQTTFLFFLFWQNKASD